MIPITRFVAQRPEVRARADGTLPMLVGYAAMFGERALIGHSFYERIEAGAFTRAVAGPADVIATMEHDRARLLGRTTNQTLRLAQDDRGLRVEIDPLDTTIGVDAVKAVTRGDIAGMSFMFRLPLGGQRFEAPVNGLPSRVITDVDLLDVSLVALPVYETTAIEARAEAEVETMLSAEWDPMMMRADADRARSLALERVKATMNTNREMRR